MDRFLKSPTPLNTPVGSPSQWYPPVSAYDEGYVERGTTPGQATRSTANTPHYVSSPIEHANQTINHEARPTSDNEECCKDDIYVDNVESSQEADTTSLITGNKDDENPSSVSQPIPVNTVKPVSIINVDSLDAASYEKSAGNVHDEESRTDDDSRTKKAFPFTKRQIFTMVILAISGICSAMFGSLLAPFFPIEAGKKGVSQTWIGILFGSYQLVGFIASPILGAYLTKIGAKFMYVSGIFINSSCAILFGVLQWCPPGYVYIGMCFASRSLEALGGAAIGTANRAIATHTFPHHISTVIGILNACSCIGLMVGPPLGGFLFELGGFFLPFLVTGSSFMLCGFLSWCLLPAPPLDVIESSEVSIPKWHLFKLPVISIVGYIVFVGQFVMGFLDVTFTIHLKNVEPSLTQGYIGLIFFIAPVVVVIFAPLIGWVADKFKVLTRPILLVGIVLASIGFMGIGPAPFIPFLPGYSLPVVLVSLAVAGVGWAALVITYEEFVSAARSHGFADTLETQGLISGVYNAYSNFGAFIGPMAGGLMNEHIGFPWSSAINALMIAAAGVLLGVYMVLEYCCCPPGDRVHSDVTPTTDTQPLITDECEDVREDRRQVSQSDGNTKKITSAQPPANGGSLAVNTQSLPIEHSKSPSNRKSLSIPDTSETR